MWYFFDESGNWQEKEYKRLVIGGIVVNNKEDLRVINEKVDLFKKEKDLEELHATEHDNQFREEFLRVILSLLQENSFKALLYVIDPKVLLKTQQQEDEIYSDLASDLLSEIAFGDKYIKVEYDMKFHYAYPLRVLENLENKVSSDMFRRMRSNFYLKEDKFQSQSNRIKKNILYNKNSIANFNEVLEKLRNRGFIFQYLWEEFRLQVEESLVVREKFKEKSITKIKKLFGDFNLDSKDLDIQIEYKGKYNQSAGVQIIDFLTNVVRFHGKNPKGFSPAIVEDIYKFITIKEKNA